MPDFPQIDAQKCLDWELEWPLRNSDVAGVLELFARGANPNTRALGSSPLSWAMACKSDEMANAIYDAGGRLRAVETADSPFLFQVARRGLPRLLSRILAEGEAIDPDGATRDLDQVVFLRDAKDWTPDALEAWRILLAAHPEPQSLLIGMSWAFYSGDKPYLLAPGSEAGLSVFLNECLSRNARRKGEPVSLYGLDSALERACSVGSQATIEALFFARKKATDPKPDGVRGLSKLLGEALSKSMAAARDPEIDGFLLSQWTALKDFCPKGRRELAHAVPLAWAQWQRVDAASQPAYLRKMLDADFPLRAQGLNDGSHWGRQMGPWSALVAELADSRDFAMRPDRIEKAKSSAQNLLDAGAWPHPAVFVDWPAFEPAVAGWWLACQDRKLWGAAAESAEHVKKVAQLPAPARPDAIPEPLQWLMATLESRALRQMLASTPAAKPAGGADALNPIGGESAQPARKATRRV